MVNDPLPQYVPVPPKPNGHKVRPDLQTKLIGAIVLAVVLYMGKSIADKVDTYGDRITRIEVTVSERFRSLENSLALATKQIELATEQVAALAAELRALKDKDK